MLQYQKALKINPENVYVHYDLGFIYKEKGFYENALSEYQKVLGIDPSHQYALWDIGVVYEKMGMKDRAEEQFAHYHEMTDCSFRRFWNCLE
jgi:tetratricopeptide (TPR) repeat protein